MEVLALGLGKLLIIGEVEHVEEDTRGVRI